MVDPGQERGYLPIFKLLRAPWGKAAPSPPGHLAPESASPGPHLLCPRVWGTGEAAHRVQHPGWGGWAAGPRERLCLSGPVTGEQYVCSLCTRIQEQVGLSASHVHTCALAARLHSCRRLGWVHLSCAACEVGRCALCSVATAWTCLGSGAGLGEQGAWVTRAGRQSPGRARRPARAGTLRLAPSSQ